MTLEIALKVLKSHGMSPKVKTVKLRRREIQRLNDVLSIHGKAIVTHSGKRAMIHTESGYKIRQKNGRNRQAKKEVAHAE